MRHTSNSLDYSPMSDNPSIDRSKLRDLQTEDMLRAYRYRDLSLARIKAEKKAQAGVPRDPWEHSLARVFGIA